MGNTGVIDRFLEVFTRYIDSGFGLLGGEVAFIASTLIVIDITLAFLFWTWGADDDLMARLIKKTLFVGIFSYLITNWNSLARVIFESFAGLGMKATGTGFTVADLLRPGKVAQIGLDAGWPILQALGDLAGLFSLVENFVQILCLLLAWFIVLLAFFILAIQLFVTLIEFKLTTLAGFVLIPFGLFGKTSFMAEKVLGNVISSGIKVMVLGVVVGIGSTLFAEFRQGFGGAVPTIGEAMSIILAALSMLALGIFGPGIANGIVSGGPQLGAGAAIGAGLAAGGTLMAGGAAASMAARAVGGSVTGVARGAAAVAGGVSAAYSLASMGETGGDEVRAAGLKGVAKAAGSAALSPFKNMATRAGKSMKQSYNAGEKASFKATGGSSTMGTVDGADDAGSSSGSNTPDWAKRMKRSQSLNHGVTTAARAVHSGDGHGGGASVSLSQHD